MNWVLIEFIFGLALMFSTLIVSAILWLVTGRYFDRLLRERNIPYPQILSFLPDGIRRGMRYSVYIIRRKPLKRDIYRTKITNFDFRAHARRIDVILSLTLTIQLIVSLVCCVLLFAVGIFS